MSLKIIKYILLTISLFLLISCDKNNQENQEIQSEILPTPLTSENIQQLEPGSYCFENDKNSEIKKTAQLLIAYDYSVTGVIAVSQLSQNKQLNDNLEYKEFVSGVLDKKELKVVINREKEDNKENRQELWVLTENSLITSQENYNKINCEKLINN